MNFEEKSFLCSRQRQCPLFALFEVNLFKRDHIALTVCASVLSLTMNYFRMIKISRERCLLANMFFKLVDVEDVIKSCIKRFVTGTFF